MTSHAFLYIYFLFPLFLPKCLEKKTPAIGIINSAVFLTYSPISFLRLLFILLFLALSLLSIPTTTFLCLFFVYLSRSFHQPLPLITFSKKKNLYPQLPFLIDFFHNLSPPPLSLPLPLLTPFSTSSSSSTSFLHGDNRNFRPITHTGI